MGSLSIWHWLIIAVVFVMFFGAKRMPDAARSLGRSLRIFKSEVSQMQNESNAPGNGASAQQPAPQLPAAQQSTPSQATESRTEQKPV
ncbi:Sec-independent protein translocase subunit TatA [Nocardia beijingensis]|uniref:Sec-independent protein translocase subunit TatA n=1 Tax=Nocardia beijingensis TaxID=95162 RepID=UPI0018963424|nr:Sec-independent protein translocase subunit TatA [Nocardia beijingensis]MBF6468949.1 Sec-independent protein translocase subunit TatA [Nocardia beijingensis]